MPANALCPTERMASENGLGKVGVRVLAVADQPWGGSGPPGDDNQHGFPGGTFYEAWSEAAEKRKQIFKKCVVSDKKGKNPKL